MTPSEVVPAFALSGGNQQKLLVGRELTSEPKVLIAAHPTRGVDIGAASDNRFLVLSTKTRTAGVTLTSAVLSVAGQGDITLTISQAVSTNGSIAFCYASVPAAYGASASILFTYSGGVFNAQVMTVYTAPLSAFSSTTPVAVAGAAATAATTVATTIETVSGGFVLLEAVNNSTASPSSVLTTADAAVSTRNVFGGGEVTDGSASGVATAAASSISVAWTPTVNGALGAISFR